MKKYLAKMLRRAANRFDPAQPKQSVFVMAPNTTSAASTITYYEVK